MKRYLTSSIVAKVVIFIALLTACVTVSAQEYENTPVEISKEKVRIGGQVCYSHIVLEKQTLYSICKTYNVSAEDIYKFNPGVKEQGLKKNSILIIPVVDQPKPTEIKQEIKEEIKQESEQQAKPAAKPVTSSKKRTHTAKWFEDLETIAAKYGVSANEIMRANNLKTTKLTKRQKLIIPNPGEYSSEDLAIETEEKSQVADTTATVSTADSLANEDVEGFLHGLFFPKKEIDMSLLLPLKATGTSASRQNMDFYSGVLLAIYDMSQDGIKTSLNVYDVADGNIPGRNAITNSDIVIGPVASGDINRTFNAMPEIKALISPLDPRAEHIAYTKNAMIHAPTPHTAQYNDLISWIKEEMMPDDRVLFITEKGAAQTDAITNMTSAIASSGIDYKPLSYSILEGRNVTETLAYLMSETATNRIYIASESEAFVNDVVRNLNVMIHQKYKVVLYAPSKIRSFDTIEVENFHNTHMRVSTGYYIDYEDPKVKGFLLRYRALFNTEPTQFAYQGYDLAKYFITLCSRYGNRWMEKLDEEDSSLLQSSFDFSKTPTGGYINNAVRRIVYDDNWSVKKIR